MEKSDVPKRLGRRVSSVRKERGYTQEQLATRCGYSAKFVSEVERGITNLPILTLAKIASALGVTVSELTLGIESGVPAVVRKVEALFAGRPRNEQEVIGRLLLVVDELTRARRES